MKQGDEDTISKVDFERWKMEHMSELAKYDAENASRLELFRSVISSAHNVLKGIVLINGGAAVALLAFIGSTWGQTKDISVVRYLLISMGCFVVGVLFGGIASGFTYFTQYSYASDKEKTGDSWRKAVIVMLFGAYILFIIGFAISLWAFWKHLPGIPSCPV